MDEQRANDTALIDAVEDLSLLSDRQVLERTCRATERLEMRLRSFEESLAPPSDLTEMRH